MNDSPPRLNYCKAPFPWFGGKADAAEHVWAALGDCESYVEPFAGSLAVLLRRPHEANRTYYSETVNDADGLLCNAWRAIAANPDAVAEAASWPVSEADLHARHIALVKWRAEKQLEHLMGDPHWHDPVMAGWWLWGQSSWIGSGWCSGTGAWTADASGRIVRGRGASKRLPHLGDDGKGVNHPQAREHGVGEEYHPMTMPELRRWMRFLSARLRHVRVCHGDWSRVCTGAVVKPLSVRTGGVAGVFLDPPYSNVVRTSELYATDSGTVAHDVRVWCIANESDPQIRIVIAGFDTEHAELESRGWRVIEWFRSGFLKGGYSNQGAGTNQRRERLWLSPSCLGAREAAQGSLFA